MGELPVGWVSVQFTDLFDINGGTQPPKKEFIYEPQKGFIRLLQIRDFGNKPVPTYVRDNGKRRTCKKDDILIGRYGASVGRICTGMDGAFNVALAKVVKPKEIYISYLKYYLLSEHFQMPLRMISRSAQNGFNKQDLSEIPFLAPPLNEQIRIANKLDSLLAKVEAAQTRLDKIPTLLKSFRQSVLAAATSGELTAEWRNENRIEKANINQIQKTWSMVAEKVGRKYRVAKISSQKIKYWNLPDTWSSTQVGYVFDVYVGSTPSRKEEKYWNGEIQWVSSSEVAFCLIDGTKEKITQDGLKNTSTKIHPLGTVMLAMIGQGKTRGQPAILNIYACHNQNTAALRVLDGYCVSKYLYYFLWEQYEETRKVGAGNNQKALNKTTVQALPFPLPPIEEQKEIVHRVESLFTLADSVEKQYQQASQPTHR